MSDYNEQRLLNQKEYAFSSYSFITLNPVTPC